VGNGSRPERPEHHPKARRVEFHRLPKTISPKPAALSCAGAKMKPIHYEDW
jgi:hypothetical protein